MGLNKQSTVPSSHLSSKSAMSMQSFSGSPSISNTLLIGNEISKQNLGRKNILTNIQMTASGNFTSGKRTYLSNMVQGGLRSRVKMQSSAVDAPIEIRDEFQRNIDLGGLEGKALKEGRVYPKNKGEVYAQIPKHLIEKNTAKSLLYAAVSTALTLGSGAVGLLIPQQWAFAPVWVAYGIVTGTLATGCWVLAHECGHFAFSANKLLNDIVGYIFHTALLVPYFSW